VVGVACALIHSMHGAVKNAKKNKKDCEKFEVYLHGLEAWATLHSSTFQLNLSRFCR